jgi:thiol-disulfide isomerase/thioredoxin
MKKLAMDNLRSPAALSIISTVDPTRALPEYKAVSAGLAQVMPSSPFLQTMNKNIAAAEQNLAQAAQQQAAPEISLNTPDGKTLTLSSLKGKYVLIDFWASWCGPCRRENPNVVAMYDKYKKKNFEILSVSLDNDKSRWTSAIAQDKMSWLHVSDLAKWNSVAARDYGVSSIPFTVLVDPEGKVVETKLRGPGLEAKLKEIFGS